MKTSLGRITCRVLAALAVALPSCLISASAGEVREDTRFGLDGLFTGCLPLRVKVEELGGNGRSIGLKEKSILAAVENQLGSAALDNYSYDRSPYLSVDVDVIRPGTVYIISVELDMLVKSPYNPEQSKLISSLPYSESNRLLRATTWSMQRVEVGQQDSHEHIMHRLDHVIEGFLSVYKQVNSGWRNCK